MKQFYLRLCQGGTVPSTGDVGYMHTYYGEIQIKPNLSTSILLLCDHKPFMAQN